MATSVVFLWCVVLAVTSAGAQRYADRTTPPDYKDEYEEEYAFEDEYHEPDVYKWHEEEFPHPQETPPFCNRVKPSWVCDPDRVLEKGEVDQLDAFIQKLYHETPCICDECKEGDGGIVVGIALLKYMYLPYHVHPSKVIRQFTETIRFRWKLGPCDNDILILVATNDRMSYTDVGSATSSYISVQDAHRIFLENKAKFSASNFSEGLMDILRGYREATSGMMVSKKGSDDAASLALIGGIIVGCVLFLGLASFVAFVLYRRCRKNREVEEESKPGDGRGTTVSSSWSKKDIKVIFGPEKSGNPPPFSSAKYQKCETEDTDSFDRTRVTEMTSMDSDMLEKDLVSAADELAKNFPSNKVLMTDM